jgi:hypothetical protein
MSIKIINNLLLLLDLEGDGGFSNFTEKEKNEMHDFLNGLKTFTNVIECYECDKVFSFNNEDVIDCTYVICPDCGEKICIL